MAKMMMGQIDHARNRVAALKAEKLGKQPAVPKIKGASNVLTAFREDSLSVTGPQLRRAFDAYINKTVSKVVDEDSGNYSNGYKSTYSIKEIAPSSVEAALATEIYRKENTAEVFRFEQETTLFNLNKEVLDLEASRVEDAIVLGDQHAALQALQDFAAFTL